MPAHWEPEADKIFHDALGIHPDRRSAFLAEACDGDDSLRTDVESQSGEVGYWLGEPFWGQGIATAAVRAFVEYVFATFDLVRLDACLYEWNPASARVLEKAGFTFEARLKSAVFKDGQLIDTLLYALVRG